MKKRTIALLLATVMTAGVLAGCSDSSASSDAGEETSEEEETDGEETETETGEEEEAAEESEDAAEAEEETGEETADEETESPADTEAEVIQVGTGNAWNPYCYLDEDGNLDGYEVKVLEAIDGVLDQYEFEFQALDWTNVLVSLDSGKIDVAAHSFQLNEERQEKYGYTEEVFCQYIVYLMVSKDNDEVNGLEDLAGKNVYAVTGEASTQALEEYNEENPDKALNLQYSSLTTEQVVAAIDNGTLDAWFTTQNVLDELNANYGDKLKFVGDPILVENTVFFIDKEKTELKEAIDGAIAQLREDGTLSELSIEYLGGDFTSSAVE